VAVYKNFAFFGNMEDSFLCVDIGKGVIAWKYTDRRFPYYSSPAVSNSKVVVGGRDKRVHCLNISDGKPVWTFTTKAKVDSSPVIAGDKVIVGSDDGRVYILSFQTGKELWSYDTGNPVSSSAAVIDQKFVIGSEDGTIYCFGKK
jgi:outer membrane protein assembly factor BamB